MDRHHIAIVDDGSGFARRLRPAPEMFDEKSTTRGLLRSRGIDFESDSEVWDWILAKDLGDRKFVAFVKLDELPSDKEFAKEGWRWDGSKVAPDVDACRDMWRNRLRIARAPKLAALDLEYMRADEAGDLQKKADIVKRKQSLRDVTKHRDLLDAKTPAEIKAFWPDELK